MLSLLLGIESGAVLTSRMVGEGTNYHFLVSSSNSCCGCSKLGLDLFISRNSSSFSDLAVGWLVRVVDVLGYLRVSFALFSYRDAKENFFNVVARAFQHVHFARNDSPCPSRA